MEKSTAKKQPRQYDRNLNLFSSTVPTIVGPKGVYTHPGLAQFLAEITEVTVHIIIWNSMKRSIVENVVKYLFNGLPQPFEILGQENYGKIEISQGQYLKGLTRTKEIFLKTLSNSVFSSGSDTSLFGSNNTILIDDNPEKSACNETGNTIFVKSWTRHDVNDIYLMDKLAPWLHCVHLECHSGDHREFIDQNQLGMLPLAKDSKLFAHINCGMAQSAWNIGVYYNCIGFSNT